jgi:hypothetical protein
MFLDMAAQIIAKMITDGNPQSPSSVCCRAPVGQEAERWR